MLYTLKIGPNGKIGRYKVCMVAKEYTQIYDKIILTFSDCQNEFIQLLFSIVTIQHWTLFQFDIKNVFIHGDLNEEVYMEQLHGIVG